MLGIVWKGGEHIKRGKVVGSFRVLEVSQNILGGD